MKIEKNTKTFGKKDALNSRNGVSFSSVSGETLTVKSAALLLKDEEDGSQTKVSCIITEEKGCVTGISATMYEFIDSLIDIIDEDGAQQVIITGRKTKAGRDFCTMSIL